MFDVDFSDLMPLLNVWSKGMYNVRPITTIDGENITVSLPGYDKDEVEIKIDNNLLKINTKDNKLCQWITVGWDNYDEDSIEATMKCGLLSIKLIPRKNHKGKLIQIK